MMERYKILFEGGEGELTEKKSRFIATTRPVESEEEAVAFIDEMKKKYWDARHNCSAYVIGERGQVQRCSDDGEPAQTAGRPMLDVLLGAEVKNICVVVTRYFGGTLLGTGGLVRAYTKGAKIAVDAAGKSMKRVWTVLYVPCPYSFYERVRLEAEGFGGIVRKADFGAEVELELLFPEAKTQEFLDRLTDMTAGTVESMEIGQEYRAFPVSGKGSDCIDG